MKVLIIGHDFENGDCCNCPVAMSNLQQCSRDDYCPLHEVTELHSELVAGTEMMKGTDEEYAKTVLDRQNVGRIADKIYGDGLCTIHLKLILNLDCTKQK